MAGQREWLLPQVGAQFPGQRGRYTIVREIARGGMGVVFQATDRQLDNRPVIIKVIRPDRAPPESVERFKEEACKLARAGRHPGIATIFDYSGEQSVDGVTVCPFMVIEYIEGAQTLLDYANENLPSPRTRRGRRRRLELFLQACDAMAYAHTRCAIVHRDLKPDNIIVDSDGRARVIDFGIAIGSGQPGVHVSEFGALVGTPGYMAPEQWATDVDPFSLKAAADVYALGVILYELLVSRKPHVLGDGRISEMETPEQFDDHALTRYMVCNWEPRHPRDIDPAFPPKLSDILLRALAKSPANRFDDAKDLARAVRRFLAPSWRMDALRILPLIAVVVWLAYVVGVPAVYEWTPLNTWYQRTIATPFPPSQPLKHVVVVAADESTPLDVFKLPPETPREKLGFGKGQRNRPMWGCVIDALTRAGPRTIAVDTVWASPTEDDEFLAASLARAASSGIDIVIPDGVNPALANHTKHRGGLGLYVGDQSVWRIEQFVQPPDDDLMPSLALMTAALALRPGHEPRFALDENQLTITVRYRSNGSESNLRNPVVVPVERVLPEENAADRLGIYVLPPMPTDEALAASTLRAETLLAMTPNELADALADKVVLLANMHSDHATDDGAPYLDGRWIRGCYAHALAIDSLMRAAAPVQHGISASPWIRVTALHEMALTYAAGALGVCVAIFYMGRRARQLAILSLFALIALVVGAVLYRACTVMLVPLVPIFAMLLGGALAGAGPRVVNEIRACLPQLERGAS